MFYDSAFIIDKLVDVTYEWSCLPRAVNVYLATLRSITNVFSLKRKVIRKTLNHSKHVMVPTLILWGQEDRILPVEQAYAAKNTLPNAKLHIFEQCGHLPQIECAQEYNQIVLDFLG